MKVETSIVINRPVEAVWTYMTDFANVSVINPSAIEQRLTSEGPLQKGSTYVFVAQFLGRRFETNAELTEFEPNRKWAYKSTSRPASAGSYTLKPVAGGTKLTLSGETEIGGFFKLVEPMMAGMVKRNLETGLAKAKAVLEAQS